MKYGVYFLSILIIGLFFEMAEPIEEAFYPGKVDLFLFRDIQMHFSSYIYYTCEHLGYILLSLMIFKEVSQAKVYAFLFIILESADIFDFWTTANGVWFIYEGWPVTFNIIKVFIFALFTLRMAVYEFRITSSA